MVVAMDVDFGHTIPQWILPYGGRVIVDGSARRIETRFR
jgi:muramoyltetrapeptide carboxypeptidase LdcA involved in peptidoglycan recycling